MPEPIELQAVQSLQTSLRGIAIADGYHHDVTSLAVKLDPDVDVKSLVEPGGARPFVIIEVAPDVWQYSASGQATIVAPIGIYWVNDIDQTNDAARLTEFYRACADVEQAIAANHNLGGFVTDTRVLSRNARGDASNSSRIWVAIELQIRLTRSYGAPNR